MNLVKPFYKRTADTEAPDLKPKSSHNKKKKNKKRRKKKKNSHNFNPELDVINIAVDDTSDQTNSTTESILPIELVECISDNCGKKFTSESALQYHKSFVHEKIVRNEDILPISADTSKYSEKTKMHRFYFGVQNFNEI